jgi:hypothetical protein
LSIFLTIIILFTIISTDEWVIHNRKINNLVILIVFFFKLILITYIENKKKKFVAARGSQILSHIRLDVFLVQRYGKG